MVQFMWLGGRPIWIRMIQLLAISGSLSFSFPLLLMTWELFGTLPLLSLTRSAQFPDPSSITCANFVPIAGLSLHVITTFVRPMICSQVDFGNAVACLLGLSSSSTLKLQSIL